MDIANIKKKIDELEEKGCYNEAIEFLFDEWMADKDNAELCAVFLGECVWTCAYQHDIECGFPNSLVNYNFIDRMIDALEYGIEHFRDDFIFQLRVGFLVYAEELWFCGTRISFEQIAQIATDMIHRAHELRPSSKVAECLYRIKSSPKDDISMLEREAIKQELDSYHLGRTEDDLTFANFFID